MLIAELLVCGLSRKYGRIYNKDIPKLIENFFYGIEMTPKIADELLIGQLIDHRDKLGKFYQCLIVDKKDTQIKVHYLGWSDIWDEWTDYVKDICKIQTFGYMTITKPLRMHNTLIDDYVSINLNLDNKGSVRDELTYPRKAIQKHLMKNKGLILPYDSSDRIIKAGLSGKIIKKNHKDTQMPSHKIASESNQKQTVYQFKGEDPIWVIGRVRIRIESLVQVHYDTYNYVWVHLNNHQAIRPLTPLEESRINCTLIKFQRPGTWYLKRLKAHYKPTFFFNGVAGHDVDSEDEYPSS